MNPTPEHDPKQSAFSIGLAANKLGGDLRVRFVSAVVMVVLSVTGAWIGGIGWALLAATIMAALAFEWGRMISPKAVDLVPRALIAAVCGLCFVLLPRTYEALAAFGFFLTLMRSPREFGYLAMAGSIYLALSGWALAGLRGQDEIGRSLMFGLFAIVWSTDSMAYVVGRVVGGPKLFPLISPNKTWSGSIGGTLAGIAAGLLYGWLSGTNPLAWALVGWLLAVVSQGGDLLESLAKRHYGVKDASGVIPGHGGVLDRLDGHLAAALAFVAILLVIPGLRAMLT
ncbi:MAG: phosphatidate cytidylyltransferase [Aquidulcibacter sp.]|uniref:phosphatidate cytidylyltransferase n=1 Tax=Aquidulcibacter sp. TaxID=2052990 RepID=UPI0022C714A8|nr:phosphatidate cytidylyltransferase [Aquidulcibacter sp.]MCE2890777.1 phosphatidate cytidylyltransferase [Hyphomonadaceae bacterium]MCZ8208075.1 phosphatidate cytidylyltransferase [Aquidulcibacter sp.]